MKKYLLLILLVFTSCTIYSQEKSEGKVIDSLLKKLSSIKQDTSVINALLEISLAYEDIDANKGALYGERALQKSLSSKWNEGAANALCCINANYLILGQCDLVIKNAVRALSLTKNKSTISSIFQSLGIAYRTKADYSNALLYSFKSLAVSEEIKDSVNIAKTFKNIGGIFYFTDDFEKALMYYNKSLALNTRLNEKSGMVDVLQNIGILYADSYKDSIAFTYFARALKLCIEQNDKLGILVNYFVTGKLYLNNNKPEMALKELIEAKHIAVEINNTRYYSACITTEASIYLNMASQASGARKSALLIKALPLLNESIEISVKSNNLLNVSRNYNLLSDLYSLSGDEKKAKEVYIVYSDLRDSIYTSESKETIKNLEDSRTIALKDKEIELNKLSLEAKEKQKWYFISGLVLLIVIGALIIRQSRNRKLTNIKLKELNNELDNANKVKAKFFGILNHDLRAPVSNLIHFLHLKNDSPDLLDEETKKRMEIKTISSAENLLASMEDILIWSKGQMENFKPKFQNIDIDELFDELEKHFFGYDQVSFKFENHYHLQLFSDKDYLKAILRNLIANAVRILEKTELPQIKVIAVKKENTICISVSDNGPGSDNDKFKALYNDSEVIGIKTGLGLHLIRDMAKAINCNISVESKFNQGTAFTLIFVKDENNK